MDPYLVFKIRRNCTRTEVQETFRERARLAHPDHGGDEKQFIKICTAYKMILSDLDARAENDSSARTAKANGSDTPASKPADDPYVKLIRKVSARSDAGKSKQNSRQSESPGSGSRTSKSATLGGVVAVVFFFICVVASLIDSNNQGMIPADTKRIGLDPVAGPRGEDFPSQRRYQPLDRVVPADSARELEFPSLPPFKVDGLP